MIMNVNAINMITYFILASIALPFIIWGALKGLNFILNI
jgi:hypothetical protein